jgi:hypothetical protein
MASPQLLWKPFYKNAIDTGVLFLQFYRCSIKDRSHHMGFIGRFRDRMSAPQHSPAGLVASVVG